MYTYLRTSTIWQRQPGRFIRIQLHTEIHISVAQLHKDYPTRDPESLLQGENCIATAGIINHVEMVSFSIPVSSASTVT
jgi:hypothetical protein